MKRKTEIDYIVRDRISEILIECRKEKGLTQAELAKELGFSPTGIAAWEQKKSLPSVDQLYRLAKYYGKTISYMYGETSKEEHPFYIVYGGDNISKEDMERMSDILGHYSKKEVKLDEHHETEKRIQDP